MALEDLSSVAQDYLKVIWRSTEWSDVPVTTKRLAAALSASASTVSEMVRRLVEQGLVVHEPYSSIELSASGRVLALAMVRRHRLLETFLVERLGYTWDEVHDEAEILEHAVSNRLMDRIDATLGYPERDPHGDPIPSAGGVVLSPRSKNLTELDVQQSARITRISDSDSEMLRYFFSVGLDIDAVITVLERREFTGVARVRTDKTSDDVFLGGSAQRSIWVGDRFTP